MKLRKTLAGILGAVVMLLGVGTFEHVNRDTGVRAAESNVTYTVSSTSAVTTSGTAPTGSVAKYSSTYNNKYQLTDGNSMTLTLSGYDGVTITGLTLSMKSNAKKGSGSLSAKAGNTTFASISTAKFSDSKWNGSYSSSYVDIKPNVTSCVVGNGSNIVITIAATVNSLYCQSFTLTYSMPEVSGHTHNYTTVVTAPTCTSPGYTTYTCDVEGCNNPTYQDDETAALGHNIENNVCTTCGYEVVAYTLVESVSNLKDGDQVVIVSSDSNNNYYAMSTTQEANYRGRASVTYNDDDKTVTFEGDTQVFTLVNGTVSGSFGFSTGNGYLSAVSSGDNYLRTLNTLDNNSSWKISIDDDGVTSVVAQGSYSRKYLQYNTGSPRFSCYSSNSQKCVSIFKYIAPHICNFVCVEDPAFIVEGQEATCTNPATYYKSCECGVKSDVTFVGSSALGHDYHNYVCTRCSELQSGKTYSDSVVSLFNDYYNNGSYTKDTELNMNDATIEELSYFHAEQNTKYRKTVYESGSVTMVSGHDGYGYGNYSRYEDNNGSVKHTGFGGNWSVNWPSVEDEFVTLNDFVSYEAEGWEYANGVYSYDLGDSEEMTTMAREFVVPMLVCDKKYLTFEKVTVQEVDGTLVMKVYLNETDGKGKVNGSENLLSTAVITKGVENINHGALITFGVNGNADHSDGSGLDLEKDMSSYSFDNYNLDITVAKKVSKNAYDAKGNSCIKMATNSDESEFTFNVSDNVNKVTIYVAGYTSNNATITVNGIEYSITTLSDNGEYTPIVVDTTNSKTVTINCAAKTGRCMIDSIALN